MVSSQSLRDAATARLGVDERALAAFRVVVAVVVLVDLAFAALDATAFYTDAGVLPRSLLYAEFPVRGALSLHSLSGALWWQYALFALLALAAVSMGVGYRSRLAAAATLLLVLSMGFRNPLVLNSGHSLLRQLLVWSVLLPIGARWSVDARRRATDGTSRGPDDGLDRPRRVTSVATLGLFVQVLVVYGMNAILKARGRAWTSGDAAELVFGMDAMTVLLGDVLAGQSLLLELGTHAWVLLLYATPLLVLATGRLRSLVVGAFASAHLGMALTISLGAFPFVSIAGLLVFLPPFVWEHVERVVDARLRPRADRSLAALDRLHTGVSWTSEDVSRRATRALDDLRTAGRTAYRVAPVVLLAGVLVWNAAGFGLLALPAPVTDTVDPTEHRWDMFAPNPLSTDAWYETVGTTTSGERVDAYAGTAGLGPPGDVDATYPSQKWYLYLRNLRGGDADARRDRLGAYLCERWNRRHDTALASVNVTLVLENVQLDAPNEVDREPFGTTACEPNATTTGTAAASARPATARGGEPKPISVVAPESLP